MKVHYISPYCSGMYIGRSINDAIVSINCSDNDWIVHVDQDVCFLRPDSKRDIEDILMVTDYDVLGCVTNRLSSNHQLHDGRFSDCSDIREHIDIANYRRKSFHGIVSETSVNIAACVMAFRVSLWRDIGGFNECSLRFDSEFTDDVKSMGGKLGIMQGVYVFHLYRMWSNNPKYDISHLLKK